MTRILQDKATATRLQILIEIAAGQPGIQQKDIARRLEITPQWVSEYILKFVEEGLVVSEGRSKYRITPEGVDWLLKMLRELREYFSVAEKIVRNISVCAAIAEIDLSKGQQVGLSMRDGLLYAGLPEGKSATGVTVMDAAAGEDIGISNIEGIVDLKQGKITVLKIPGIQRGGSRNVDLIRLGKELSGERFIGAIGIESLVVLKQIKVEPNCAYGTREAIVKAAQSGISSTVVCVDDDIPDLLQGLGEQHLSYKLLEMEKV